MNNCTDPVVNQVKKWCTYSWSKKINFMDWVAYWWGRYGSTSPSTKVLHGANSNLDLIHDCFIHLSVCGNKFYSIDAWPMCLVVPWNQDPFKGASYWWQSWVLKPLTDIRWSIILPEIIKCLFYRLNLSRPSHWQKSFVTFGLGSSSQILVANWKNIHASFTDKE